MSEVQSQRQATVEAVMRALGASQRRREKQVRLIENQIDDLMGTLHRLKHDLAAEDPAEKFGRRRPLGTEWRVAGIRRETRYAPCRARWHRPRNSRPARDTGGNEMKSPSWLTPEGFVAISRREHHHDHRRAQTPRPPHPNREENASRIWLAQVVEVTTR